MHQQQRPSAAGSSVPVAAAPMVVPGQVPGTAVSGQSGGSEQQQDQGGNSSYSTQAQLQQGANPGTLQNNQLSSVYRLLHAPDSAAQLQLWRYQLPSPQLSQSAYSYHDSAQKAAVDRAGRFAQGPLPWRNTLSPPESAGGAMMAAAVGTPGGAGMNASANVATNASVGASANTSANTSASGVRSNSASPATTAAAVFNAGGGAVSSNSSLNSAAGSGNPGFHSFPSDSRRNTQEAVARGIAERHRNRPIAEYAAIVRQAEIAVLNMDPQTHSKTFVQTAEQNRERERQVYALLWLMKNCQAEQDSYVPRGRIFAQYAASCAKNGLKPLSQASLGKLIRAVFPDLTTRRLGMRGQSRYHYCGLKLVGSVESSCENEVVEMSPNSGMSMHLVSQQQRQAQTQGPSSSSSSSLFPGPSPIGPIHQERKQQLDQATYSRESQQFPSYNNVSPQVSSGSPLIPQLPSNGYFNSYGHACSNAIVGLEPSIREKKYNDYEFSFLEDFYERVFSNERPVPSDYALKFPNIPRDQLPGGFDADIISALESLYHVHCNTIFEHVRFMKFEQLPNCLVLFGSGSISPQMYNLFTHESLHRWVYECDLITHVSLIKCLSRMVSDFNSVPANSIVRLGEFARSYDEMVAESTIDLPVRMVAGKTEIVRSFSRLVRNLIQLVKYLRETDKILPNFRHMSKDWLSYDNLDDVLYVVNRNGYEKIVPIIRHFMSIDVTKFVDELAVGDVRLDMFVRRYCEVISSLRDVPACKIMECIMMFSKIFTADISIEMQQKGYPWYVLDMLSNLLIGYCYELNRFV